MPARAECVRTARRAAPRKSGPGRAIAGDCATRGEANLRSGDRRRRTGGRPVGARQADRLVPGADGVRPAGAGARSILVSPIHAEMRARLKDIKDREDFRPVTRYCRSSRFRRLRSRSCLPIAAPPSGPGEGGAEGVSPEKPSCRRGRAQRRGRRLCYDSPPCGPATPKTNALPTFRATVAIAHQPGPRRATQPTPRHPRLRMAYPGTTPAAGGCTRSQTGRSSARLRAGV
jgi:hypothetical protein